MSDFEFLPEGQASKWSLLAGYNTTSEKVDYAHLEDTWNALHVANYVWDTTTLGWVKQVQNVLTTDSVYLAVDGVEALLTTIDADTGGILTAVQIMDDWDESDRCKVNLISGQSAISGGAGAVAANTPRVTLASNDPAVAHLATLVGCVSGTDFSVDIVGNTIGLATEATLSTVSSTLTTQAAQLDTDFGALLAFMALNDTDFGVMVSKLTTIDSTLTTQAAQLDTDFGALLVYAEAHDTDFGTMISHLNSIKTAVEIMDDWDLNDRCRVSPISGQDGVQAGEGAITALTQRVTIATDDDMVTDIALLLAETQDNKQDYFLGGWLVDGTDVYVGKEDKAGNYMVIKHDTTAGTVTYEGGSGGLPSSSGWAAMAFQAYSTEF